MRNLMLLYQIALTFCFIAIIGTACATSQKINTALLEQNKNKTFLLGQVEANGDPMAGIWGSSGIEYKMKALSNIPILEICSILSSKYSIAIDANVDKTWKAAKAAIARFSGTPLSSSASYVLQPLSTETVNFKMYVYEGAHTASITFAGSSPMAKSAEFPNVINVEYSVDYNALGFKTSFHYEIGLKSAEQDILKMHGIVASISTPRGILFADQEAIWNLYVDYAGRITEALKRDLFEASNQGNL